MDDYDYSRGSEGASVPRGSPPASRTSGRDRDDYRSSDPYRDRRRSPDRRRGGDRDRDRERRRSRSPAQIDRYQPDRSRDDYGYRARDDAHQRRRPSPQAIDRYIPGPEPPALLVNPLPDPMKLDYQVGFTWFAEWWRAEQRIKEEKERTKSGRPPRLRGERESREDREAERPKIQAAYDQYKEALQKLQAQTFVRLHRNEDWFRERYVPEARIPFRQKLMDYRRNLFAQWEQDLTSGIFDEFSLEGIYKSEFNGAGGIIEREEGETSAANEVLGVGDLLPSKGADIKDPVALQPTLLIKTIAPTVTRDKFVEFAKEHLGEGEGGFQHLSLSDPNPLKKCHRMGWIILHPEPENDEMVEEQAGRRGGDGEEGEEVEADGDAVKAEPSNGLLSSSEKALEKINGKTIEDPERGSFTIHCGVHRPPDVPRKKALWDLFSAPERIVRDLELATRLVRKLDNELGDEYFGVAKIEERVNNLSEKGLLIAAVPSKPAKDPDAMMEDGGEEDEEDEGMIDDEDETDDEELLLKKKKLDLLVEYLRRVYNFCFFCVFESDSVHELQRKCPGGHLRRPRASLTSSAKQTARASALGEAFPLVKKRGDNKAEGDDELMEAESPTEEKKAVIRPSSKTTQQLQRAFNWVKTFEEKILQVLEPDNVNIRKLGGTPVEEGVDKELGKFVLQEDVNKFRCKIPECTKLFKGVEFWQKHVEKRHTEWYERIRAEVELVNTYVLDPSHIAPSRSDANSNGHFPINNQVTTGTPRGFQLSHQFPMGFPMAAGMPGGVNGMPPMFNGQPVGMAGAWAGGAPMGGGVGPMRNNGRNYMMNGVYRMPGPYVRNGRGRNPSMSGGRPIGMTEGGNGTMGPSEAVQGRSLRSYEDLDADKGEGTGELNY